MNETMIEKAPTPRRIHYRSYLLRLWSVSHDGDHGWQASLEDATTGCRIGFANLEELFVFLMRQSEGKAPGATQAQASESET